jgi:hypothetical protein
MQQCLESATPKERLDQYAEYVLDHLQSETPVAAEQLDSVHCGIVWRSRFWSLERTSERSIYQKYIPAQIESGTVFSQGGNKGCFQCFARGGQAKEFGTTIPAPAVQRAEFLPEKATRKVRKLIGVEAVSCSEEVVCKWRAQGDDFRTFLSDFVSSLTHLSATYLEAIS